MWNIGSRFKKILLESKKLSENETFTTPGKTRKRTNKKVNIDNFQISALQDIIHNFHITHKKLPSLRKLILVLKTEHPELQFNFTHETLRKILKSMGFN